MIHGSQALRRCTGQAGLALRLPARPRRPAHLKNCAPAKAPVVEDLPHIKVAANDYYDKYWTDFWQRLYGKYDLSPETEDSNNQ